MNAYLTIATFTINSRHNDLVKRVVQYLGLVYLTFGTIISYLWFCIDLDVKFKSSNTFNVGWMPLVTLYSLINVIIFVGVCFDNGRRYGNLRNFLNLFIKNDEKLIYFIILPLFIISLLLLFIITVETLILHFCKGFIDIPLIVGTLFLLISTMISIYDISNGSETNGNYEMSVLKRTLLFFTVIALINSLVFDLVCQHLLIFISQTRSNKVYQNVFQDKDLCNSTTYYFDHNKFLAKSRRYLRPFLILFYFISIGYLIQPLVIEDNVKESIIDGNLNAKKLTEIDEINQSIKFRLPRLSLLVNVFFMSLSILAYFLFSSISSSKVISVLVYNSLSMLIYSFGIYFTILFCKEVLRWPINDRRDRVFDNCILWVGAMGQMFVAVSILTRSATGILYDYPAYHEPINREYLAYLDMTGFCVAVLLFIQTFFQTILISLSLDRKWSRPVPESWVASLCPAVGMAGLNIGLLLMSILELQEHIYGIKNKFLSIEMFLNGLHTIGESMGILQRLYSSLYFATMIIHTYN